MARPKEDPKVKWKVSIDAQVAAIAEVLTFDPSAGKPRHGARSALIEKLLTRYYREIGFTGSVLPLRERRPLTDDDLSAIDRDNVEKIYL